jgi:hypothetical protein
MMKRLLIFVFLAAALTGRGQETTNELALPRPFYRYLFLVDTSSAMSRQRNITMDTISRLILNGIGGRIHTGEAWNIWTFDDKLHTNVFPAQLWDLQQRAQVADRAYRFLRDQRLNKKKEHLDKPLLAVANEAERSGALTVFLFTDGSEPIKGTPFDAPINEIFAHHAAGMRKAKKPFVIVLVAKDGQFAAHAVTPGGAPIYVPGLPTPLVAATEVEERTNTAPAQAESLNSPPRASGDAAAQSPPRKALTVEEVSAALAQARIKKTNALATATPAPLIVGEPVAKPDVVASNQSAKPDVETSAPTPNPGLLDANQASNLSATVSQTPTSSEPVRATNTEPDAHWEQNIAVPADAGAPPGPQRDETDESATATSEKRAADSGERRAPAPPQTTAILQPEQASKPWTYLAAAAALLLLALALACLYIRSIRYVPRPSLISRSMEKEKLKSE